MEGNIDMLNRAIQDKQAPMQVSQTRLDTRTHRPNFELCRDRLQYKLINEVNPHFFFSKKINKFYRLENL